MSGRRLALINTAILLAAFLLLPSGRALASVSALDPSLARSYFLEAEAICRNEGGKLWGVSLCGPILFVAPETRVVYANGPDREGALSRQGEIYVGQLPAHVNVANTAVEWAGVKWTMVMTTSLPRDAAGRAALLAHEMWHRVQEEAGFPASGAANDHLDTMDGRVWLQLEWRALSAALANDGPQRRLAIADALLFRAHRRSLFSQAAVQEREMELHEGLAEYTGVRLSGRAGAERHVAEVELARAAKEQSFVRSFAYASGAAYGLLLDRAAPGWTRTLSRSDDFGSLLQKRLGIKLPPDPERSALRRAAVYDFEQLTASEAEREKRRQAILANYRVRLVEGAVLRVPLRNMRMTMNPGNLVPFGTLGTVYPNVRVVDVWGILTVERGGALMSPTFSQLQVAAPADPSGPTIRGDGWTLELNADWALAPGEREGDYVLRKITLSLR
jgi:hypothetical protein